ncbi:MAG: hypothetical protein LLG14_01820 [Nocardiaceae bacterium]|nr:hypothetical protein [Nocardiaceae bacterium]
MNYPPSPNSGWQQTPTVDTSAAIVYSWKKFAANPLWWILLVVAYAVVLIIDNTISSNVPYVVSLVFTLIGMAIAAVFQVASFRGALFELDGQKPEFADFFKIDNWPRVLGAALLATVLGGVIPWLIFVVGSALAVAMGSIVILLLFGLVAFVAFAVVMFLTYFTIPFALDKQLDPVSAVRASYQLIRTNVGPLLLLALANVGLLIVGAIPCGLGLLVTMPMVIIASSFAFRTLTQGPISPADVGPQAAYPQYPNQPPYPPYPPQQPPGSQPPYQQYPPQQPPGNQPPGNQPPFPPPPPQ